jgi:long-chain fatty acid transport protein
MTRVLKSTLAALLAGAAFASAAQAGGYSRGSANLDPLLEEGTYFAASMAITAPSRNVESTTVGGVTTATTGATAQKFTKTYATFGATAATDIVGGVRCAGSFAQPYGADADYGNSRVLINAPGSPIAQSNSLASSELGLTCGYGFDLGGGKLHVLGGAFYQSLDYVESRGAQVAPGVILNGIATINMSDSAVGYRLGAAYTMPEIALKASLIYRSAVDHRMTGTQFIAPGLPGAGTYSVYADATLPQSVKLSLQSGIAPGWLAFGSVEWTDWSVLQQVSVRLAANGAASPGSPTVDAFFKDGWTVNAGVGHKFNDLFSGSFSVTWDKGVSAQRAGLQSGFSDTWTFAAGAAFTPNENASIRAGLAYSLLSSASERNGAGTLINLGSDQAISGGFSANVKF